MNKRLLSFCGLAFAILLLAGGAALAQDVHKFEPGSPSQDGPGGLPWGKLPDGASTYSTQVDVLYKGIFWVVTVMFALTEGLLILFCIIYRRRPGHRPAYTHGNKAAEVTWTIVPACILLTIAIVQIGTWNDIKKRFPDPTKEKDVTVIDALAQQFQWNLRYPGTMKKIEGDYDATSTSVMHLPFGDKALVNIRSSDVIHSMFIPEMRVKQDLVPGIRQKLWFQPNRMRLIKIKSSETLNVGVNMDGTPRNIQAWFWVNDPAEFEKPELKSKAIAVDGYLLNKDTGMYETNKPVKILQNGQLRKGPWGECEYCVGIFEIACAELCGLGHYKMRGQLIVEPRICFESWLKDLADVETPAIWKKHRWKD